MVRSQGTSVNPSKNYLHNKKVKLIYYFDKLKRFTLRRVAEFTLIKVDLFISSHITLIIIRNS